MPSLRSSKPFIARDGERLQLLEFDAAEAAGAWRDHVASQRAQPSDREPWYSEYRLQICSVLQHSSFHHSDGAITGADLDPDRLRAIAQRWLDAFARHHLDDLLALYAEDAVHTSPKIRVRHPDSGGFLRGKQALRAWWRDAFERLPGLHYQLTSITADGERVFMEYVRQTPGEPDLPVAEVLDVRGDHIVASRVFHG